MSDRPEAGPPPAALDRLAAGLGQLDCIAAVVVGHGGDPDLDAFLAGAELGDAVLVLPRGGAPRLAWGTPMERDSAAATGLSLLPPEHLQLDRLAREHPDPSAFLAAFVMAALAASGLEPGRVALAGSWGAGTLAGALERLAAQGWVCVPGNDLLRRFRKTKSAADLSEIRRVAAATGEAFAEVAAMLAHAAEREGGELWLEEERLTVGRLKRAVALVAARHELSQPRSNIIAPAEEGAVPHNHGTPERVLRAGESLVVDLFPKGHLFADATRTFCVGEPPEALRRAHGDVREALERAHRDARPGVRGWDLQEATCRFLADRGWPTPITVPGTLRGYVHGLGHGVGHELHEYPTFRRGDGDEGLLEVGDVITLEPGLYEPAPSESRPSHSGRTGWGIRLEDLVHLAPEGPENLTPWPLALDPRAWE